MSKLLGLAVLLAFVVPPGMADAVTLYFDSTGAPPLPGVAQVDMWLEDRTRDADLLALQFDLDLPATGIGSLAAIPGFKAPNAPRDDGIGEFVLFPFDLSATVSDPPGTSDVRVAVAASRVFDIDELEARSASLLNCYGSTCAYQLLGNVTNRVYLGSFNINYDGTRVPAFTLPVESILGEGAVVEELRAKASACCRLVIGENDGVPEPAGFALTGFALAALGCARWRAGDARAA